MVQASTTKRPIHALAAALAVLAGLLLWTAPPADAAPPQLPLDHFRCYRVIQADPEAAGVLVLLQDQFAIPGDLAEAFVGEPSWFCNPAEKRHRNRFFEITNPDGHLKFYRIDTAPNPERVIKYRNQFGAGKARLGQAIMLAVPTQKQGHPPPDPASLDHFKCYDVLNARPANAVVGLRDQWRTEPDVEVGGPVFFCNPTRKFRPDTGESTGISNPNAHLMCYRTSQTPGVITTVLTFNQFGDESLIVDSADVLCVPTRKGKRWKTIG